MTSNDFIKSLKWKREYKSDRAKYQQPYQHQLNAVERKLIIHQRPLETEGFASTVWDSSIVVSKYLEKHLEYVEGKRCLDLSAGCGLVAIVMSYLHPMQVIATDLSVNVEFLRRNCESNAAMDYPVHVMEYCWGKELTNALLEPFDTIVACDVMYLTDQVPALVSSLEKLIKEDTKAFVCYGRNASAEDNFLKISEEKFNIKEVQWEEFDSVYRSEDITCLQVTRKLSI